MSLEQKPLWNDCEETITFLANNGVKIDDELCNSQFGNLVKFYEMTGQYLTCSVSGKWTQYFEAVNNPSKYSQLLIICEYMFSLVGHNANVERIFNLVESQWTDERNRLTIDTIRPLIFIKHNYNHVSCIEFFKEICSDKSLLKQVKGSEKYDFVAKK